MLTRHEIGAAALETVSRQRRKAVWARGIGLGCPAECNLIVSVHRCGENMSGKISRRRSDLWDFAVMGINLKHCTER